MDDVTFPYVRRTARGVVQLDRVERTPGQEGQPDAIEVWVGGETESGDPHFRIFNAPEHVLDPEGDVEINGLRFRHDPMAALAEAVAQHGGAQGSKRSRRAIG